MEWKKSHKIIFALSGIIVLTGIPTTVGVIYATKKSPVHINDATNDQTNAHDNTNDDDTNSKTTETKTQAQKNAAALKMVDEIFNNTQNNYDYNSENTIDGKLTIGQQINPENFGISWFNSQKQFVDVNWKIEEINFVQKYIQTKVTFTAKNFNITKHKMVVIKNINFDQSLIINSLQEKYANEFKNYFNFIKNQNQLNNQTTKNELLISNFTLNEIYSAEQLGISIMPAIDSENLQILFKIEYIDPTKGTLKFSSLIFSTKYHVILKTDSSSLKLTGFKTNVEINEQQIIEELKKLIPEKLTAKNKQLIWDLNRKIRWNAQELQTIENINRNQNVEINYEIKSIQDGYIIVDIIISKNGQRVMKKNLVIQGFETQEEKETRILNTNLDLMTRKIQIFNSKSQQAIPKEWFNGLTLNKEQIHKWLDIQDFPYEVEYKINDIDTKNGNVEIIAKINQTKNHVYKPLIFNFKRQNQTLHYPIISTITSNNNYIATYYPFGLNGPEIQEHLWRNNDSSHKNPQFLLGVRGINLLIKKIKKDLGFGPEFFDLKRISLVYQQENLNGEYLPATQQLFLNLQKFANVFKTNQLNDDQLEQIIDIMFQTLFHEYLHHFARTYLQNLKANDKESTIMNIWNWKNDKYQKTAEAWNKYFVDKFKKILNYHKSTPLQPNNSIYDNGKNLEVRSIAALYDAKKLFDLANGPHEPQYKELEADAYKPHNQWDIIYNFLSPKGNINDAFYNYHNLPRQKYLDYIKNVIEYYYTMDELFARKYTLLNAPSSKNKNISKNGVWTLPNGDQEGTTLTRDISHIQSGLNPNTQYLADNPFASLNVSQSLIDLYHEMNGQQNSADIAIIKHRNTLVYQHNNDANFKNSQKWKEKNFEDNDFQQIKFGGWLDDSQEHFKYVGYVDTKTQAFQAFPIQKFDYENNRLTELSSTERAPLIKGAKKFYIAYDPNNKDGGWITAQSLLNKKLYFAHDVYGQNKKPLQSIINPQINPTWTKNFAEGHNINYKAPGDPDLYRTIYQVVLDNKNNGLKIIKEKQSSFI